MKIVKQSPEQRGLDNKKRFVDLARSLQNELPRLKVRWAGSFDDANGIDVIVYIPSRFGRGVQKIPFQIKSSLCGESHFREKHSEAVTLGLPIFVLNEHLSDDLAAAKIFFEIERQRYLNIDFKVLFYKNLPRRKLVTDLSPPRASEREKRRKLAQIIQKEQQQAVEDAWRYGATQEP